MFFASSVINLQYFTESFLTGTSIGHSRDAYVNVQMLLLWLSVLFLAAVDCGAELKQGDTRLLQWWYRLSRGWLSPVFVSFCLGIAYVKETPAPASSCPGNMGFPSCISGKSLSPAPLNPMAGTHPVRIPVRRDIGGLLSAFPPPPPKSFWIDEALW